MAHLKTYSSDLLVTITVKEFPILILSNWPNVARGQVNRVQGS